jgi:5'-nucleotidase
MQVTRVGHRKVGDEIIESNDPNGKPYFWIGAQKHSNDMAPGTDVEAIQNNLISVSPLSTNITHRAMVRKLHKALKSR